MPSGPAAVSLIGLSLNELEQVISLVFSSDTNVVQYLIDNLPNVRPPVAIPYVDTHNFWCVQDFPKRP